MTENRPMAMQGAIEAHIDVPPVTIERAAQC